jgi:hypothetical protein
MRNVLLIGAVTSFVAFGQGGSASIQGMVADALTNKPLADVLVLARSVPGDSTIQTAKSGSNGNYSLDNLPAGTYSLCMKGPDDGYLDPCEWGQKPTTVTLQDGKKSSGNRLLFTTGSVVKIRIQDTSQLLFQKTKTGFLPDLSVGIFGSKGLFYPARVVNRDIRGLDLQITIPFDTPVSLSVTSRALKLTDESGKTLPATAASPAFQHAHGGANNQSFTYVRYRSFGHFIALKRRSDSNQPYNPSGPRRNGTLAVVHLATSVDDRCERHSCQWWPVRSAR